MKCYLTSYSFFLIYSLLALPITLSAMEGSTISNQSSPQFIAKEPFSSHLLQANHLFKELSAQPLQELYSLLHKSIEHDHVLLKNVTAGLLGYALCNRLSQKERDTLDNKNYLKNIPEEIVSIIYKNCPLWWKPTHILSISTGWHYPKMLGFGKNNNIIISCEKSLLYIDITQLRQEELFKVKKASNWGNNYCISPSRSILAFEVNEDVGKQVIYDLATKKIVEEWQDIFGDFMLALDNKGNIVERSGVLWDANKVVFYKEKSYEINFAPCFAQFSNNETILWLANQDGYINTIRLNSSSTSGRPATFKTQKKSSQHPLKRLTFSDFKIEDDLLFLSTNRKVFIYDIATQKKVFEFPQKDLNKIFIGSCLLGLSGSHKTNFLDIRAGKKVKRLKSLKAVTATDMSADTTYFAQKIAGENFIQIWDLKKEQPSLLTL